MRLSSVYLYEKIKEGKKMIQDIFSGNCVAVVFVVSIILNLLLPKNMEIEKLAEAA